MGFLKHRRFAFGTVFAVVLTVVVLIFQARVDFRVLTVLYIAINSILIILISLVATILLMAGYFVVPRLLARAWRVLLVNITLHTLRRAIQTQSSMVQATAIGERQGSVVFRLETGSNSGVTYGTSFTVSNTATGEAWGDIEVVEVDGDSCICIVFNRTNPEFWNELEARMRRDASPPQGVTIKRALPEDIVEIVTDLLNSWRG